MTTMTCKTIEGNSLTQQLFYNYKRTLPSNGKGVKWTIETYSQAVKLLYPEVGVVPGQEWKGVGTKLTHICEKHGEYEATPNKVLTQKGCHLGSQCSGCSAEKAKARKDVITADFVGKVSPDGHIILEHVGYYQAPSDKKRGCVGQAKYRYRCAACGSEDGVTTGADLKKPGHTTHCGCLSKRDSAIKFSRNKRSADAKCFLYLFTTDYDGAIKVGITNNLKTRPSKSYKTEEYTIAGGRADCWAAEQVLLHRLRKLGVQYDLEDMPMFQTEEDVENGKAAKKESGGSEVFVNIGIPFVVEQMENLMIESIQIGWDKLLDKYIPLEDMCAYHLFRYDRETKRQYQPTGEGYEGQPYRSVFDLN